MVDALRYQEEPPNGNVLVIGDQHEPFTLPGYLQFCLDTQRKYGCSTVVHIGDLIDAHSLSQYDHDPDGFNAGQESTRAVTRLKEWYQAFPIVKGCMGNHDHRADIKAFKAGIPKRKLKTFKQEMEMPEGWDFQETHVLDGVMYRHQGGQGVNPAYNYAIANGVSTVMGHTHTARGVRDMDQYDRYLFGLDTGCGIDKDAYSMAYAKNNKNPIKLGCGVVVEGGQMGISVRMGSEYI